MLGGDWPAMWDPPLFGAPCFIPTPDSAALDLQEKEKLAMLERRYHSLTGGRPFPKTTSTLKEVTWLGQPQPHEPTGLREALEKQVAPSPQGLRPSVGTFS